MIPVIALVGRPNVGKSTLFNRLTKTRSALVADVPGLTRDRQYGEGRIGDRPYIVIDTGGIGEQSDDIDDLMAQQSEQAIHEADCVLFLVDARAGLSAADQAIAKQLRRLSKSVVLVANKIDGLNVDLALGDFFALGFAEPQAIAAVHGRGVNKLIQQVLEPFPAEEELSADEIKQQGIKLAIVGRPNVGKSTLVNRMLGEERVVVFDLPGTTRDSVSIPLQRHGKQYTLVDTAGVRRRARVKQTIEKFSVIKTLQSIEAAHVVLVLLDAREGITDQDLHLIGFVLEAGKGLCLALNKWDDMAPDARDKARKDCERRLDFVNFAPVHFISALHGSGVGNLFSSIDKTYASATQILVTSELTRILEKAVIAHPPPLVQGRRIKLRYAHAGGHNPPLIVIHGNQTERLADSYKRYLINTYRKAYKMIGTPIRLQLKSSENPFKGKKQTLTPRQERKRKRMMHFHKTKKK